jgi:hypothetical protein
MATRVPLELRERNDEILDVTITRASASDDLTVITSLEFVLKPSGCDSDDDPNATVLTTADPDQILITSQSASQILATVYVPATALAEPYDRVYRLDGLAGSGRRRTGPYGPVTVVNL